MKKEQLNLFIILILLGVFSCSNPTEELTEEIETNSLQKASNDFAEFYEVINMLDIEKISIPALGAELSINNGQFLNESDEFIYDAFYNQTAHILIEFSSNTKIVLSENNDDNPHDVEVETRCGGSNITFYDDTYFRDRELSVDLSSCTNLPPLTWCITDENLKETFSTNPVKKGFNDKCSSFIVENRCFDSWVQLTMYEDTNFEGRSITYDIRPRVRFFEENLHLTGFNDKMSSYRATTFN